MGTGQLLAVPRFSLRSSTTLDLSLSSLHSGLLKPLRYRSDHPAGDYLFKTAESR
jgi:hypothetical protein